MAFKKGEITNPRGREKGSHNRISHSVRMMIAQLVDDNLAQMQSDLNALDAKDRLDVMLKLMRFVIPTLASVTLDEDTAKTATEHLQAIASWTNEVQGQSFAEET